MKQNNTLLSLLIFLGTFIYSQGQETSNFYLADNGLTCMCPDAAIGDSATLTINGVNKTFTKRDRAELDALIAADENDEQIALTCTSGIVDMSDMFYIEGRTGREDFNQDLSSWDVSNVTNMGAMFSGASTFNQDLSSWDVSGVTDMSLMFLDAEVFNQDISSWDVSSVTEMSLMFGSTGSFNQNISSWDVSNVTAMSLMFSYASAFNQNLSFWNVSKVNDMQWMFKDASVFNGDISSWDVSNVTNMHSMFSGASAFNGDISLWDVSSVTTMTSMFMSASSFNQDLSSWSTNNVTTMYTMFFRASAFNGDISSWDVSNVTNMILMFSEASAFNQNLSNWCVALIESKPTDFDLSSGLTGTNLPKWGEACLNLVQSEYEVILDENNTARSIVFDDINFIYTSSSDIANISLSRTNFSCSDLNRDNEVTLTVENEDGETDTAVINIKVLDQSPPVIQSKDITLYLDGASSVSLGSSLLIENLTDNCTGTSDITLSVNQDTFTSTGTYTIELTAEDASKNSTTTNVEVKVEDATLSANEFSNQASFKLYPNPASNHITFEASDDKIKAIHIYDMMGRLVLTSQKLSFSLHNLPTGMYLAKVFNYVDQTSTVLKFIKE